MAVRIKTKWHRSRRNRRNIEGSRRPKTAADLAGVIAFNIWKIAQETFSHMEKEGFRFARDEQAVGVITEMAAFLVQIADRMVCDRLEDEQRGVIINTVAKQLAATMQTNKEELFGPGDYTQAFVDTLNDRFVHYAECGFGDDGPGYAFKRYLGEKISEVMAASDNKWVIEHVMEIEVPEAIKLMQRLVRDVIVIPRDEPQSPTDS